MEVPENRKKRFEKVINNNNLYTLNNKSQIYLNPSKRSDSATDII